MNHKKALLIFFCLMIISLGCSRQKDRWINRTYHKTTSRFNPYFNGMESYKEGKFKLEQSHKDDYDKILSVYDWGDEELSKSIVPEMDRAVEKGSKVIQTHSMYISGKQLNVYIIHSYMLIGRARFLKWDLFPALETFNYVISQFPRTEMSYEAYLWAGRTQVRLGNYMIAENYFNEIYGNRNVPKNMVPHIQASMAEMFIKKEEYDLAKDLLIEAIKKAPSKKYRVRWTFILAQLESETGNKHEASKYFEKVVKLKPNKYEVLFEAQIRRARNFDIFMENPKKIYRDLTKMLKDDKNKTYRDRIYYAMAEVAMEEENWPKAEEYLSESIKASVDNPKQKGISFLTLGNINYDFKDYVPAQANYDSAVVYLPKDYEGLKIVTKRKESLTKLVKHIRTVELNDSLIALSGMSEKELQAKFLAYTKQLRKEDERKRREEELAALNRELAEEAAAMASGPTAGAQGGGQWYFYNENSRGRGRSEFRTLWGSERKDEDNWRYLGISGAGEVDEGMASMMQEGQKPGGGDGGEDIENDPRYDPATYISKVPKDSATIADLHAEIRSSLFNQGLIYNEDLQNMQEAIRVYENYEKRYPHHETLARIYYALYRIYNKEKLEKDAKKYADLILEKYPNSLFAKQLRNESIESEGPSPLQVAYKSSYKLYESRKFAEALSAIEKVSTEFPGTSLEPKFLLLQGLCYAQTKGKEECINTLEQVVENHPKTPEAAMAESIIQQLTGGAANAGGKPGAAPKRESPYKPDEASGHQVVYVLPSKSQTVNNMRNELSTFNQTNFRFKRLQIKNIFLDANAQLVIIAGFSNAKEAMDYYKMAINDKDVSTFVKQEETKGFVISNENFRTFFKDKDVELYLEFFQQNYK